MVIFCVIVSAAYWLSNSDHDKKDWAMDKLTTPNNAALQSRINRTLFDNSMVDIPGIGADVERTLDPSAMAAKLSGLTKNVTTQRSPSAEQLEEFYQQNKADYREASKLWLKIISFRTAIHGGQVFEKAQQALQADSRPSGDKSDHHKGIISLQLEAQYGRGFTEELLLLSEQSAKLPCWAGPISSASGVHLVCVERVVWGAYTPLEEIRSELINDWRFSIAETAAIEKSR